MMSVLLDKTLDKIQSVSEQIRALAGLDKRIIFVYGAFNVVHPGHLRLLHFADECGDFLVVGVYDDTHESAFLSEEARLAGIRAISCVDATVLLHDAPEKFIACLKP